MSTFDVYKALFPPYYSARSQGGSNDATRRWLALELPYIRVFGPMWSFGLRVVQLDDVKELPGLGNAASDLASALALRTLFQKAEPAALGALAQYQAPVLMRAAFDRFLQPTNFNLQESRLSLLAVDTIEQTTDGALDSVSKDDLPVELDGKPHGQQGPIIVSPFGNAPRPKTVSISDSGKPQYLPAMQMLHGLIRFKPTAAYLAKVRKQLGLTKPDASLPDSDTIVLLPDGFAVAASVVLPWMGEEKYLSGWFKATWRRLDGDDGMPERVLKLWFDPTQPGHDVLAKAWVGYLDQLDRLLRGSSGKAGQPHWLAIGAGTEIMAADLVWPENNSAGSPLFSRVSSANKLSVDAGGLILRLSNRAWTDRPLSVLTVQPPQFDIERRGDVVVLTASVGKAAPTAPSTVSAHYRFSGGQTPAEKLYFKAGGDDQRPVVLAVPLIETADRLRQATGIARPEPGAPLGLLWTFSPVAGGWLHWPLPNATQSSLSPLLTEDDSVKPAPEFALHSVLGALNFGNQPGAAGFDSTRREWNFSLAKVQEASLELRLDAPVAPDPTRYGAVLSASVNLTRMALSFNGFAVVTPYRQTPQRLLPDHAERALCSMPLRADSPESLIGIEADLWRQQELHPTSAQVNMRVELSNFSIEADAQGTAAIAPGATVAWTTSMTGASSERGKWAAGMQPWMWKSHPSLPVVQSMPMSAGGNARNRPLRSRALAPLMLAAPPQHGKLVYSGTLDMDSAGPDIAVADAGPAPAPATFQRPSAGAGWTDGIGMAVLTLPSVTMFAGTAARLQDVKQPSQWSALSTPVHIVLRSDLSLRDEHYGFARAPGPAQSARTEQPEIDPPPPPEPVFSPLPDNGPGVNGVTNGWDRVWRSLQRKTALAALDRREMLTRTSKTLPYTMTGVFGNTDYDIKDQGIDIDLHTTFVAGDKSVVKHIGSYEIKFDGHRVAPAVMQFEGLPAASDLQGLNGTFERNGQAQELRYGTAKLSADPKTGFTDQFGLTLQSTRTNRVVTIKTLSDGAPTATAVRQVSVNTVLNIDAGQLLHFSCTNVPVGERLLDMFSANKGDLDVRSNSAGLDYNHLAAFRWSLTCPGAPAGLVIVQGLVFEPLELAGFTLDAKDLPAEIKVRGSLRLPVRMTGSTEQTLPQAGGEAILTISRTQGKDSVELNAKDLSWPLADPATFRGLVPTLHIADLPKVGAVFTARLLYRFGERDTAVDLVAKRLDDGQISASWQPPTPTALGVDFIGIELALSGTCAKHGKLVTGSHACQTSYQLQIGPVGACLTGALINDLLGQALRHADLRHEFTKADYLKLSPMTSDQARTELIFQPDLIALCWKGFAEVPVQVLGGLAVGEATGTLMAALVPSTEHAIASYRIVDLDVRARFALTTYGNDGGPAQPLALELGRSGSELSYSLTGPIKLTNSFTWPRLDITTKGQWQISTIPGEWTQGFKHDAEIAFKGQRISPAGLAMREDVTLMVEVSNAISLNGLAPDVEAMTRMQWRAFQLVRLLPLARLRTLLEQAKPPLPGADLKAGPTAFSPLLSKHDVPLIAHSAGRHILQTGAANPGNLSGVLAERLLAYIEAHPVDALAFDFSNHALLAFDPDAKGADKLTSPLVLSSLPALAFASAKAAVKVVPDNANDQLARMFAARPKADTTVYLANADAYAAHRFASLEPRMAAQAVARIMQANAALDSQSADLATQVVKSAVGSGWHDAQPHMPVFQALLFREWNGKPAQLAYEELPAAAAAFLLSEMFAQESDSEPLAIGFAQHGRVARADSFEKDATNEEMDNARDFDPRVYQRSLGRFRDWAARNILPGPDVLPRAHSGTLPPIVVQADTLSRDGSTIVTLGRITITEHTGGSWLQAQEWARRTLQRSAPWAAYGMLTARASGFGLDPMAKYEVIRTKAASQTRPQRSHTTVKQIPAQPQRELVAPLKSPVPGLVAGYVPMQVTPALFKSERGDDPRLSATGVTVSWMLAAGAGALVRPGPADGVADSSSDEFWITDRERIAFRPAKRMAQTTVPAELTFILPERYGAALPRALTPAASTIAAQPLLASERFEFEQAFAPPRVSTGRIAARAGAWTSTRTGLMQSGLARANGVPEVKQALLACRAAETPVHVRQPRPALLARNDRPRASSHENDLHVSAARQQSVVVHGPRAARAGGDLERVGLNRNPRSLWATLLVLGTPTGSVIWRDWDGAIMVAVETWLGKPDEAAQWTVVSAVLVVNGLHYVAPQNGMLLKGMEAASLRFDGFALQGDPTVQARAALRDLAPATHIDFELNLTHNSGAVADRVVLNRQARFALLSGGSTAHAVETPLFFRFDDPEFNDRLGGLAKLKRIASPISPGDDFVFAAEVSECQPTQRIELALALKAATSGAKVARPMLSTARKVNNQDEVILYYGTKPVRLLIERLRKETAAFLTANDVLCVTNTIWDREQGRFLHLNPEGVETQFFAMTIDCGLLRLKGEELPALMAGDQLKLSLIACKADCTAATSQATPLVSLTLDVVNRPTMPSNAAAFAVLALERPVGGAATVDTHCYAYGPEPEMIEIVDPRDLIDGLVRRRAVYMWPSFHHFKPTVKYYFALQKISGGGATWLPASLTIGWIGIAE